MEQHEEILHAELQAQDLMHDRSHLMTPEVSKFHAYQKMIQDQMLHGSKWHDKYFPSLVEITSTRETSTKVRKKDTCILEIMMKLTMMLLMTPQLMMPMMMTKQVFHGSVKIPSVAIL